MHEKADTMHHMIETKCNKFKMLMGDVWPTLDFILRYQKVQVLIHKKSKSVLMRANLEKDNNSESRDDEEEEEMDWIEKENKSESHCT